MNNDVFISYSHHDKKIADALCHYLEQSNIKCWIAPRDINSGEEYGEVIEKAICNSKIFLLLYSKDSSVSPWVKGELNIAFSEEKYIAPVRIDDTSIEGANRLILNQMHWIDIFPFVERNFSIVKESIQNLLKDTNFKQKIEETPITKKDWNWKRNVFGNKMRSILLLIVFVFIIFTGKYMVCFLCSIAAQVGLWIEPLNLDTENMNLPDTAMTLWLPVFLILALIFTAQAFKRKSVIKFYVVCICLILCISSAVVGSNSLWYYGHRYSDGYWIFEKNGDFLSDDALYGARNMFGIISIPAQYEEMWCFDEGYSVVKKDGYWGAIDKSQKIVVPFNYTKPYPVENFLYGIPLDE